MTPKGASAAVKPRLPPDPGRSHGRGGWRVADKNPGVREPEKKVQNWAAFVGMEHAWRVGKGVSMARVLIVDDTQIVRKALEIAVRKMGHDAYSTSDAREALQLAETHCPDLALLDYRMPDMDGVQLFGAMRNSLGARCPKVLFISATPAEDVLDELENPALQPFGFVKKPFHLDDLTRMVYDALDGTKH
jgi:two-component system OmpR family response regulator